jgi:hypothetical protein
MSGEPKKRDPVEARWQPIAVVSLDKAATKPPRSRWWSALEALAFTVMAISFSWGAADLQMANTLLVEAEPPLRAVTQGHIASYATRGSVTLIVGSVLFGCFLGAWTSNLLHRMRKHPR